MPGSAGLAARPSASGRLFCVILIWPFQLPAASPAGLSPAWAAIIAALAALVGVLLTAIITARQAAAQRKALTEQATQQLEAQREQFRDQQRHEREQWRLELRRQAYADFLASVEKMRVVVVGSLLTAINDGAPNATINRRWNEFAERYADAYRQGQLVRLEGPPEINAASRRVISKMVYLRNALENRVRVALRSVGKLMRGCYLSP